MALEDMLGSILPTDDDLTGPVDPRLVIERLIRKGLQPQAVAPPQAPSRATRRMTPESFGLDDPIADEPSPDIPTPRPRPASAPQVDFGDTDRLADDVPLPRPRPAMPGDTPVDVPLPRPRPTMQAPATLPPSPAVPVDPVLAGGLPPAAAGPVDPMLAPGAPGASAADYPIEFGKGVLAGAKNLPASSLKGAAALDFGARKSALELMDRIDAGERVPREQDILGYGRFAPGSEERRRLREMVAGPMAGGPKRNPLFQAGEAIEAFGTEALAPAPGFEGSWTRDIGGGFGSVAAGIGTAIIPGIGPFAAGGMFLTAGSGEAADRAARAGATDEQIAQAARFGTVPGATDLVDALLPALGSTGRVLGFLKRVGLAAAGGALAEGGQEGLQQLMQNAIARGIYKPDQDLLEDVPRNVAIGAIVGGATSGGIATAQALNERRAAPEAPAEPAGPSPLEGDIIPPAAPPGIGGAGRAGPTIDGEVVPPAAGELPALPSPQNGEGAARDEIDPRDRAILRKAGYSDEMIDDIAGSPAALAAELADAQAAGVTVTDGEIAAAAPRRSEASVAAAPRQSGAETFGDGDRVVGTRGAPARVDTAADLAHAEAQVNTEPSDGQKAAGNYRKGHLRLQGLDITIENPAGSTRAGRGPDGEAWSVEMPVAYGYVKGTRGRDGDQVDVFIGPDTNAGTVFLVDQNDLQTGRFDEHKALIGFKSEAEARAAYESSFSDGRGGERIGALTPMPVAEFKAWLGDGGVAKPAAQRRPTRPLTVLEFLAYRGGLRPDGDLRALGLSSKHRVIVPGVGWRSAVRGGGLTMDEAVEALREGGYLPEAPERYRPDAENEHNVVWEMLDEELRGRKRFPAGEETYQPPAERRAAEEQDQYEREQDADRIRAEIEETLRGYGVRLETVDPADLDLAVQIAQEEGLSAEDAFERAVIRNALDEEVVDRDRVDADYGWGAFDAVHSEPALPDGAASAAAGEDSAAGARPEAAEEGGIVPGAREAGERDEGAAAAGPREGARAAEAAADEPSVAGEGKPGSARGGGRAEAVTPGSRETASIETTPAGEQAVLPGAEQIGQGEQAKRGAEKPMRGKVPQKAPAGLFSDEASQTDLVDMVRADERPLALPEIAAAIKAIADGQGGFGTVYIADLIDEIGRSKADVHAALRREAKAGTIALHPNTSVRVEPRISAAAITLPGFPDPFESVTLREDEAAPDWGKEPPKLTDDQILYRLPGEDGLLAIVVRNSDGKRFNVVLRFEDEDLKETLTVKIVDSMERARDVAKELLTGKKTAAAPKTLAEIVAAADAIKAEQFGFSAIKIFDLARRLGVPATDLHPVLLAEAKAGRVTLHHTTSVELPRAVIDAGIRLPGFSEPFVTVVVKPEARTAQKPSAAPRPAETTPKTLAGLFAERLGTEGFGNILAARRFAKDAGHDLDAKQVEEALELGVVLRARQIAAGPDPFPKLVELYKRQPKLGTRTSTSVRDQAYSTPVPLAYVAARLAGIGPETRVYEPTAGNGALLITAAPGQVTANEINPGRAAALRRQGFKVTTNDASAPTQGRVLRNDDGGVDAVIANPPFGAVREGDGSKVFDLSDLQAGYETTQIDHAIALRALEGMRDDGRAVLIIGGPAKTATSAEARSDAYNGKAKREFFLTLYSRYNVVDHLTVAGELYERQGAGWPVDVIVIDGRGKSRRKLPAVDVPRLLTSWDQVGGLLDAAPADDRGARQPNAGAADGARPGDEGRGDGGMRPDAGGRRTGRPGGLDQPGDVQPNGVERRPGGAGDREAASAGGGREPERPGAAPAAGGRPSGVDEFDQAFDAALDEVFGPQEGPKSSQGLRDRIIDAYAAIRKGQFAGRALIADISERLNDVPLPDLHAELEAMQRAGDINLYPLDNKRELTDRDRATALHIAGNPRHIVWIRRDPRADAATDGPELSDRIIDAYLAVTGGQWNARARLADLRAQLPDVPRQLLDEALKDMELSDAAATLMPLDNRPDITDADRAAALHIGREPRHLFWIQRDPRAPKRDTRPTGKVAASAARNAAESADAAMSALVEMFGGGKTVGMGLAFDEETYAKAKPLFVKAAEKFGALRNDVVELVRRMVAEMQRLYGMTREVLENMRPYLRRFIEEVQGGIIRLGEPAPAQEKPKSAPAEAETEGQVSYQPQSVGPGLGTLVPRNMSTSVRTALERLEAKVGNLDAFVAAELGFPDPREVANYFAAEQVDALALGIDNLKRGAGFIIGDQTGIGKGRVNAGIIRWAIKHGRIPIFVTEKPNLYGDMYRDLTDIGIGGFLGHNLRIVMTNSGEKVPLDEEGKVVLESGSGHNKHLDEITEENFRDKYDVVFTTYNQMQTLRGSETERRAFLRRLAPAGVVIFDESHNAGGQKKSERGQGKGKPPDRAAFARALLEDSTGVFYSSATYAKRPDVMDLYRATDMRLAVSDPQKLGEAIGRGGIPMQQVVASMLAESGQYIRRERSFDGVVYGTPLVPVSREVYDGVSRSLAKIQEFSKLAKAAAKKIDKDLKGEAASVSADSSTGGAGAESVNFTSVMHNLINQMLLGLKAKPAAQMAIEALQRGEKPVITLANTMESFLTDYADAIGITVGEPIDASFKDVLKKYLERTRTIIIKPPFAKKGETKRHYLTDEELGPFGLRVYEGTRAFIETLDVGEMPASPIDLIRSEITKAGFRVGEITGRTTTVDYSGKQPVLQARPGRERSIRGRRETIAAFNGGEIDVIILNQAGSTGLSLHASAKFKDQRRRHMILAQAEANIDTHMQMLGRVHRTGQVVTPIYSQLIADIPAEKRPAAVLAKKMASLNANTTGARGGALTAKDVPDFINHYGDRVAAAFIGENPELNDRLGAPVKIDEETGKLGGEDTMRRVTGRIPLLTLKEQEELYEHLESEYKALIEQLDAAGENALEAKTLDLKAETIRTDIVVEGSAIKSPFAAPVTIETVSVARLGKPYKSEEVVRLLAVNMGIPTDGLTKETAAAFFMDMIPEEGQPEEMRAGPGDPVGFGDIIASFKAYRADALVEIESSETQAKLQERLNATLDRFSELAEVVKPGMPVTLKTFNGNIYGVVLKVERKGKAKNPVALSVWKATFAIAHPARQITLPFSQLYGDGKANDTDDYAIEVMRTPSWIENPKQVLERFDNLQSEAREERVIATGNLLAAYDWLNAKGQIVNYTTRDGGIRQGILTPVSFDLAKQKASKGKILGSPTEVVAWLKANPGKVLKSTDELVELKLASGFIDLFVPASKKTGGRFFLDSQLIAILGKEFYKRGDRMHSSGWGDTALAVAGRLQAMGVAFAQPPKSVASIRRPGAVPRLTRVADGNKSRLARELQSIVRHLVGTHVDLRFQDYILVSAAEGWGSYGDGAGTAGGTYTPSLRLIRLALADPTYDPHSTAFHESWHAAEHILATDEEIELMRRETPRLRKVVREWPGSAQMTDAEIDEVAPFEIRAMAAEAYGMSKLRGEPLYGIHVGVRRFFERVYAVLRRLRNWLQGLGFRTMEDVFEEFTAGEMAGRPAAERTTLPALAASFAGRQARTADTVALGRAKEMASAGAARFDVWSETGWFQGRDGRWRFEVPDDGARLTVGDLKPSGEFGGVPMFDPVRLGAVLDHPELYAAYPYLRGIKVHHSPEIPAGEGAVHQNVGERPTIAVNLTAPEALQPLLHEIQHIIQRREGFSGGTSPGRSDRRGAFGDTAVAEHPEVVEAEARRDQIMSDWNAAAQGLPTGTGRLIDARRLDLADPAVRARKEAADAKYGPLLDEATRAADDARMRAYGSASGEVEARNVVGRADYGHNRRRGVAPWESEDVPAGEQWNVPAGRRQSVLASVRTVPPEARAFRRFDEHYTFDPLPEDWREWWRQPRMRWSDRVWGMIDAALLQPNRALGDKYVDMRRMQAAVELTGRSVPEGMDMALAAMLFEGRTEKRLKDYWVKTWQPVLQRAARLGLTREDLHWYLYARHAPERNSQIARINPEMPEGGSGMTDAEAAELMERFRREGKRDNLEAVAGDIDRIVAQTRAGMIADQLESDRTIRSWTDTYRHYVPLRGFEVQDENEEPERAKTSRGFDVRGPESRRALGRKSRADDILSNLFLQGERAIIRGEQNRVGRVVLRFMQSNPQPSLYTFQRTETVRGIGPNRKRVTEDDRDLLLGERPVTVEEVDRSTGLVRYVTKVHPTSSRDVFAVKVGGETYYVRIRHEGLLNAVKAVGVQRMPWLFRAHGWLTRQFAALRTARNPDFFVANLARDLQDAAFTIDAEQRAGILRHFAANVVSLRSYAAAVIGGLAEEDNAIGRRARGSAAAGGRLARLYEDWKAQGGQIAFMGLHDMDEVRREIEAAFRAEAESRTKTAVMLAPRTLKALLKGIEFFNGVIESGTRLAVYDAALKAGLTRAQAARLSKEATTNFNRKGIYTPFLNSFYAFFNARMQGGLKILRLLRTSKTARYSAMGLVVMGFAATIWNLTAAGDDEEKKNNYAKRKYWEREKYFMVFWPGSDAPVKLPMGYGLQLFWMLGENLAMLVMGQQAPGETAANYLSTLVGAFSPLSSQGSPTDPGTLLRTITPSIEMPTLELYANEDWRRKPIRPRESERTKGEPHSQQYFTTTSPLAIDVAQWLNRRTGGNAFQPGKLDLYPGDLQYAWTFAAGGLGATVNRTDNWIRNWMAGVETPSNQIPILRHFAGTDNKALGAEAYYEEREKVRAGVAQTRRAIEHAKKGTNLDDAQRVAQEGMERYGARPGRRSGSVTFESDTIFRRAEKALADLRRQEAQVKGNPDLSRAEATARIAAIRQEMRSVQERAREAYREMRTGR
jgi:predicted RNA methylase